MPRADNAGENSRRIIESITIAVRNDHLKPTELQFRNPRNTSGNTATFSHTGSWFSVVAEPATSCASFEASKTGHCFFFLSFFHFFPFFPFFFLPVHFHDPRYNPRVDGVAQAGEILFRRTVCD